MENATWTCSQDPDLFLPQVQISRPWESGKICRAATFPQGRWPPASYLSSTEWRQACLWNPALEPGPRCAYPQNQGQRKMNALCSRQFQNENAHMSANYSLRRVPAEGQYSSHCSSQAGHTGVNLCCIKILSVKSLWSESCVHPERDLCLICTKAPCELTGLY